MDKLIEQHDELLENAPEDFDLAEHEKTCPICNKESINDPDERGDVETFSREQLDAAVLAAIAPLEAELKSIKDEASKSDDEARQAAADEAAAKIVALQSELDAAELKVENAEKLLADSLAWIQAVVDLDAEAARLDELKESRSALVKEQTSFSEEKIAERIDDWAMLSEDEFAARLADWAELSTAKKDSSESDGAETAGIRVVRPGKQAKTSFMDSLKDVTEKASAAGYDFSSL
ncbi:hypothetical protein EKI60_04640 [Candidatus Saccharibacteria bacterium]|nr:MAG: hypothetical protein EKI60_04640 [Candidatus Saccharibacteria bacterium]